MRIHRSLLLLIIALAAMSATANAAGKPQQGERKTCSAPDGVTIVYSAVGSGEPALVFVHGGLANRNFWDSELKTFSATHRVIALDLAGHGESGTNRRKWGIPEFGADVRAVVEAEHVGKVVLFGNSLGGPVAIEAALLLPGKVLGVVGVDTFQNLTYTLSPEEMQKEADAFRANYANALKRMTKSLFHADADPALIADTEQRMAGTSPEVAHSLYLSLRGYSPSQSARRLTVPLRAINGDLFPTDVANVRQLKPDFDVVVMKHMGHYPMLERPAEFDHLVEQTLSALLAAARSGGK